MQGLQNLFMNQLEDMFNAEHQITMALPKLIKKASQLKLRATLSNHLKETRNQIVRLKKVFVLLKATPKQRVCPAMKGLLSEGEEMVSKNGKHSAVLDAAIIAAAQKVEHYEMATYGTLRSFANHLKLNKEISKLLQQNLNEEGAADKALTKIAEGTFFTTSVNTEAAHVVETIKKKTKTKNALISKGHVMAKAKVATKKASPVKKVVKKAAAVKKAVKKVVKKVVKKATPKKAVKKTAKKA